MSSAASLPTDAPVRKSISVRASAERAFEVFTTGMDSWWPRSHHIGKAPMKRTIVEGRVGGRCYSEQIDGTECDWAQITEWDPPRRFVMAWTINSQWQYEPDFSKASEVEVCFTAQSDGSTRVDLEHRHFDRVGADWENMRASVDSDGGWGGLLKLYIAAAERPNSAN
jgi:Activator of Hsp90 ATPase homolog 1-like protein